MQGGLFIRILNTSMVSCYTIVVVMVLRALLLRWERKYAYLLWFVVFVNLCIPFRIEGPFSLVPTWIADFDITGRSGSRLSGELEGKEDYLPNEQIVVTETGSNVAHYYTTAEEVTSTDLGMVPGTDSNSEATYIQDESEKKTDYLPNEQIVVTYAPTMESGVTGTDVNPEITYHQYYTDDSWSETIQKPILALVWGIGLILLAAGNLWAVWKFQRKLKNAEPFSGDCGIEEYADKGIKTADGIESPFLWGLFSPVIYLPRTIDAEECRYIIAHESYHRKRRDYIFKPLFFMITAIHWFNPLAWAAYLLFVRDMEISCDEAVIANADEDIRKKYAESLLKYAARQNGYTLTPITFGEPSLKCRVKNVLQYKERNMMISVFVLCAVAIIMAGLFFKPRQDVIMKTSGQGVSNILAIDSVDQGAVGSGIVHNEAADKAIGQENADLDITASQMGIGWKSGIIKGLDGENEYTQILLESDSASGEATDFRTFLYMENLTGEDQQDKDLNGSDHNVIAYVMAGEEADGVITGSLWLVDAETRDVQSVMQNITMTDTQAASILFEDAVYIIINYLSEGRSDGRILPVTKNAMFNGDHG